MVKYSNDENAEPRWKKALTIGTLSGNIGIFKLNYFCVLKTEGCNRNSLRLLFQLPNHVEADSSGAGSPPYPKVIMNRFTD